MNSPVSVPEWLTKQEPETQMVMPLWLNAIRKQHWEDFISRPLPTRKQERWKYTDLSLLSTMQFSTPTMPGIAQLQEMISQLRLRQSSAILLVMINGHFMPMFSDLNLFPVDVTVCHVSEALDKHTDLIKPQLMTKIESAQYPFATLNAARFEDGLFIHVGDHCEVELPIHLLSVTINENEVITHPRHVMMIGDHGKATVIEEHYSSSSHGYLNNVVTSIDMGKNAQLQLYKLQHESKNAIHMAHTFITQKKDSMVSLVDVSVGGLFARNDVVIQLQEKGAECKTSGFYHLTQDDQYIDYHVDINHHAPRSQSEMLFKGILDKKSRAVFNGRLSVEKDAQKILAYQANHNLLLSSQAEVYSKPELEIYADDVKCKHGSTTGQIDQDALFYMRSRGMDAAEAMHILLQGFAEEVIQRITHLDVKRKVKEMVSFI